MSDKFLHYSETSTRLNRERRAYDNSLLRQVMYI
jgi:hypothetical protein